MVFEIERDGKKSVVVSLFWVIPFQFLVIFQAFSVEITMARVFLISIVNASSS